MWAGRNGRLVHISALRKMLQSPLLSSTSAYQFESMSAPARCKSLHPSCEVGSRYLVDCGPRAVWPYCAPELRKPLPMSVSRFRPSAIVADASLRVHAWQIQSTRDSMVHLHAWIPSASISTIPKSGPHSPRAKCVSLGGHFAASHAASRLSAARETRKGEQRRW